MLLMIAVIVAFKALQNVKETDCWSAHKSYRSLHLTAVFLILIMLRSDEKGSGPGGSIQQKQHPPPLYRHGTRSFRIRTPPTCFISKFRSRTSPLLQHSVRQTHFHNGILPNVHEHSNNHRSTSRLSRSIQPRPRVNSKGDLHDSYRRIRPTSSDFICDPDDRL